MLVAAVAFGLRLTAQTKPVYEYKYEDFATEKKTNELASQGWELVTVASKGGGGTFITPTFIYRREKH